LRAAAERAQAEADLAQAQLVSPLNRVEIKPPIAGRIEDIRVAEGSRVEKAQVLAWMSTTDRAAILDAARAQGPEALKRWDDVYRPTPIAAPLAGEIILKNIVVGQTVDQSSVLFALSDRLIVLAQVDEVDIGRVTEGLPARITLDAYPQLSIPGRVFNILHEGKNVSNVITYGVKVAPEKTPPFFRSQMTANVSFVLQRKESALLVPAAAVQDRNGVKQVLVPGADGKPSAREVTTGLENGESVEILTGVNEGDSVLVVRKKYTPQKGESSSPLVMSPGRRSGSASPRSGGAR
nr:HlyD family efflux transporter periplasmic adaptor subunit [Elusimicrobiota bacterium]